MANSKVSGLPAAASLLPTHEFPVNEAGVSKKVTGAQITAAGPGGTLAGGYAQVVAAQAGITAVVDLTGLTVTVTVGAGRRIRISSQVCFSDTVAGDQVQVTIAEGATTLDSYGFTMQAIGQFAFLNSIVILTPSAGAHTYKLTGARTSGTGTLTLQASATSPSWILAEDIGV